VLPVNPLEFFGQCQIDARRHRDRRHLLLEL
jgi:hypothetical protein